MLARDYVLAEGEEFWFVRVEYSSDAEPSGYGSATYCFVPAFSEEQAVRSVQETWRSDVAAGRFADWDGELYVASVQREGHEEQAPSCEAALDFDAWLPADDEPAGA